MKAWFFSLLFFVTTLLSALPSPTARWFFLTGDVVQGHPITLSLEVVGTDKVEVPALDLPGVQVTVMQSAASRTVAADGSPDLGYNVIWSLRSYRPGVLTVPGRVLKTGKGELPLPALTWRVNPGVQDGNFRLVTRLEKPRDLYPGLTGVYTVEIWKRRGLKNLSLKLPILGQEGLSLQGVIPGGMAPPVPGEITLRDQGVVMKGRPEPRTYQGQDWQVLSFSLNIRPLSPGRWAVPEGYAVFEEELPFLVQGKKFRPRILTLPSWTLEVKPLPDAGRPEEFSGLLGALRITTESPVSSLPLGDAAPLYLRVEGLLGEETLDLDAMLSKALDEPDFRLSRGEAQRDGRRLYHLRFQKTGSLTFPALELNYFNPDLGTYARTVSKPLVFQVTDPRQNTAGEVSDKADPLLQNNQPGERSLTGIRVPVVVLGLAAGGVLLLGGALWGRSNLRKRRLERRAWVRLWKNLPQGEDAQVLRRGLERIQALGGHPSGGRVPLSQIQREWEQALWSGKPCPWNPQHQWKRLREEWK